MCVKSYKFPTPENFSIKVRTNKNWLYPTAQRLLATHPSRALPHTQRSPTADDHADRSSGSQTSQRQDATWGRHHQSDQENAAEPANCTNPAPFAVPRKTATPSRPHPYPGLTHIQVSPMSSPNPSSKSPKPEKGTGHVARSLSSHFPKRAAYSLRNPL